MDDASVAAPTLSDAPTSSSSASTPAADTPRRGAHMAEATTEGIYDGWSRVYDATFGRLVHRRHRAAVAQLRAAPGDRVLELGVGTGMSLGLYPRDLQVLGIDLSPGMLAKAQQKADEQGLDHVELQLGNALDTGLPDRSFDRVVINHTVSVVSEPNRLMREAKRLTKPDGRVVLLNHFRSAHPIVGGFERIANPLFVRVGWRSDLSLEECLDGVGLRVLYRFKLSAVDFWQIVVLSPTPRPLDAQADSDPSPS